MNYIDKKIFNGVKTLQKTMFMMANFQSPLTKSQMTNLKISQNGLKKKYVIVDKPDRLARDFINQLFIEKELLRNNVTVLFASNESTNVNDADTEMDKMMKTAMRQMMGIFAEIERKMIVKRLTDGMKKKARGGNKAVGRLPFGYEYSDNKKSTLVNQAQAKVIRNMFEMRKSGLSTIKIADALNKKRNTSDKHAYVGCNANRNPWNAETVRRALM